jgi:hypothetical protein
MQEVDPRVPDSRKYPLEDIIQELLPNIKQGRKELKPLEYFTSGGVYAIALAIYQGYDKILFFGFETEKYTEREKQREGLLFWLGYAAGRGIELEIRCLDSVFQQPKYGYETNKGKVMLLSLQDRLRLLGLLPKEGTIATIRIVRKLREDLSFSEEEMKDSGLVEVADPNNPAMANFTWVREIEPKEIEIGEVARKVVIDAFTALERASQMTEVLLDLYDRFTGQ